MKKLFGQIALVLSLLCFGNTFAQQVVYQVSIPPEKIDLAATTPFNVNKMCDRIVGQMIFHYKSNGYEATMNGEKLAVEVTGNTAVATMGKLIITMSVNGTYYHNRVGFWRTTPVTTSFGDKGIAKMFYAGMTPNGRLYREELWLNGRLFNRSETVIDHNDQIVWSVATDSEGTLRLARL